MPILYLLTPKNGCFCPHPFLPLTVLLPLSFPIFPTLSPPFSTSSTHHIFCEPLRVTVITENVQRFFFFSGVSELKRLSKRIKQAPVSLGAWRTSQSGNGVKDIPFWQWLAVNSHHLSGHHTPEDIQGILVSLLRFTNYQRTLLGYWDPLPGHSFLGSKITSTFFGLQHSFPWHCLA